MSMKGWTARTKYLARLESVSSADLVSLERGLAEGLSEEREAHNGSRLLRLLVFMGIAPKLSTISSNARLAADGGGSGGPAGVEEVPEVEEERARRALAAAASGVDMVVADKRRVLSGPAFSSPIRRHVRETRRAKNCCNFETRHSKNM